MPEMTAADAAENLERLAKDFEEVGTPGNAKILRFAASTLLRVASGELAPVVHAHWIEMEENIWQCSHCGLVWEMSNDNTPQENEMFRCPKCGALMDGKEDSHEPIHENQKV